MPQQPMMMAGAMGMQMPVMAPGMMGMGNYNGPGKEKALATMAKGKHTYSNMMIIEMAYNQPANE
jgi:hypothetical protein